MNLFMFGLVCGILLGAFVLDVNVRAPDRLKRWIARWFPGDSDTKQDAPTKK